MNNLKCAFCIVNELVHGGVEMFCISPGSRSTPLAFAIAKHPEAKSIIIHDERAAGFFAFGYAKNSFGPVVLVCTSGTALANYFPAVVEAYHDEVPIIILSADRPHELISSGSNQTIDQTKIFGSYSKFSITLPAPSADFGEDKLSSVTARALDASTGLSRGPVHLNCMFRKPLINSDLQTLVSDKEFNYYLTDSQKPKITYEKNLVVAERTAIERIISKIRKGKKFIVVVGELTKISDISFVGSFIYANDLPVITDIFSQLRLDTRFSTPLDSYDLYKKNELINHLSNFDIVLHLGGRLVSEYLVSCIKESQLEYIQVSEKKCYDPKFCVDLKITCDISNFIFQLNKAKLENRCEFVNSVLGNIKFNDSKNIIKDKPYMLDEASLVYLIGDFITNDSDLFLGNSMPVRLFNIFVGRNGKNTGVFGKRATSGIDGCIATAIGIAESRERTLTLVIGDTAFLHDLNSLSILRRSSSKIVIVLINNGGGNIFYNLPVADIDKEIFNEFFYAPHELTFYNAAEQFGLNYSNPGTSEQFIECYSRAQGTNESSIIEVFCNPGKFKEINF